MNNVVERFKNGRNIQQNKFPGIRKMQTASGGPIYEEDWSDRWEPYAAKIGLAGDAVGLGAAATGIGIPVASAIAAAANTPNLIIDGYQTVRDAWRAYKDKGASLGSAAWNGGELILDAAGLKILSNINKAAKAGVASEKYLTSTEKALDSKPWKRVGTGHGRVRARQSADHKRKYNARRNKALEESNLELAKRGVRPTQELYYQRKLTDEMAKRGYGVAVNDAIKSANKTLRQNLGAINGISGGTNLYHIFKKEKGGMLQLLKKGSGIHIKKKNRGKFTDYCGGKVTSECIAKGKASSNPAIRKRATFADNARHFKHKKGGKAFHTGVNVLDSNPKMSKAASKKVKKAEEGTKLNTFQKIGNFLNSDSGKAIGSTLMNGISAGFQAKQMTDAINEYEAASKAKLRKLMNFSSMDYYNKALQTMNPDENLSTVVLQKRAYDIGQQEAQKIYNNAKDEMDQQIINLKQQASQQNSDNVSKVIGGISQLGSLLNKKQTVDNGAPSQTTQNNFWTNPTIKNSQVTGDFWNKPTIANSMV